MSQLSIFALELCVQYQPALQETLHQLIRRSGERLGPQEKWAMWGQASAALLAHRAYWYRGCWDFFDDDTRARSDFNMWVSGMLTAEGARTEPLAPLGDPYRAGGPRFLTFTMAALMIKGVSSERQRAEVRSIPEHALCHVRTFARLLVGIRHINFGFVRGSTLYVIPRDADWALTAQDLEHPKFQYLRPIA